MKPFAALALVLAACATNAAPGASGLDVRDTKYGIAGTFQENGTAINFRFTRGDIELVTVDGFRIFEDHHGDVRGLETYSPSSVGTRFSPDVMHDLASMPELAVIRDLPGALHDRGIEIDNFVTVSPALGQILCPTRTTTVVDGDVTATN